VGGVGVDADEAGDLHVDARFLLDLPDDRVLDGLAQVVAAARERPKIIVGAVHQEQPVAVHRDGRDRWDVGNDDWAGSRDRRPGLSRGGPGRGLGRGRRRLAARAYHL